jgi:hypothetical protein
MNRLKFVFGFFFALLISTSVFSQNKSIAENPEENPALIIKNQRIDKIKADILKEIQILPGKDQAYNYAYLGNILWNYDQKEGLYWMTKGVELAMNPTTEYKDNAEKLSSLWNILSNVLEEDPGLTDKLVAKIKQIKIDESNPDILESVNRTYIVIAQQLLTRKGDDKSAIEFAMLSLKGKQPAINWRSSQFFRALKFKNEILANSYFAKVIETVKKIGDKQLFADFVNYLVENSISNYPKQDPRFNISDSQKTELLEFIFPSIQNDSEELALKKRNNCGSAGGWGARFLEDYKRLLPNKSIIVEQALGACQNADIDFWKKPDFQKRPRKTSQDYLDLAKLITDKQVQINYLETAAAKARDEKNYPLANNILESIDKDSRNSYWTFLKIDSISNWIKELSDKNETAEINKLLDNSPPEFVPFIIVRSLNSYWRLKPEQKEFVLDLLNLARAGFNKIDRFPINSPDFAINPTIFGQLPQLYVKFGFYDEAIATHEESIKSLNRLFNNLPPEFKGNKTFPIISSYSTFSNQFPPSDVDFVDRYFDRIYDNIGKIENSRVRLSQHLNFFRENLRKVRNSVLIPYVPKS